MLDGTQDAGAGWRNGRVWAWLSVGVELLQHCNETQKMESKEGRCGCK